MDRSPQASDLADATALLTDLGPRLVATPQEALATDAVAQAFIDAGLSDVRSEPFTWDAWQPGSASISVGEQVHGAQPLSPAPTTQVTAALAGSDASSSRSPCCTAATGAVPTR